MISCILRVNIMYSQKSYVLFKELQYALEEIHKQKTSFQTRLNDREGDIDKLRNQVRNRSGIVIDRKHFIKY